jgi:hypothetical protein
LTKPSESGGGGGGGSTVAAGDQENAVAEIWSAVAKVKGSRNAAAAAAAAAATAEKIPIPEELYCRRRRREGKVCLSLVGCAFYR